ncbi:hypothetical protein LEP1GSC171_0593 [Leptospira santarosai str. HAI1380]|uniref:Uncharacterized protein n=1 Tax=Leptospira santarosai str. ZUN179 TaxID=1049985 RepID=M6UL13_9LEPT|nr:hypothetical protein LEP1GSC071_3817 [Leptospira santarosai str. JET]EMO12289.1 hypothetical protein LEP1GSC165_4009 [Leptospira santarosai str. CBC523]EMO43481.1 hypothetical protein LEP1GSC187_2871 [Leptospira santarosai str. ZUN179]EMP03261.1 hypothetical protein LEP1GSC171_0593 [Leptospira santarosai str. HAI1380]EMP82076.1 hypothetical protein LEP1GSC162_1382 [Leptospira santarosai str. CBC1531]EPG84422.1 hypothetical protein LEP1GSC048_3423 [Leptospira santarosai serovar Shermani str.
MGEIYGFLNRIFTVKRISADKFRILFQGRFSIDRHKVIEDNSVYFG